MKLNKKGFTLVELLAVIAILAILMLLVMPSVLGMFTSGRKDAFKTEAQSLWKSAESAYVNDAIAGKTPGPYCSEDLKSLSCSQISGVSSSFKYYIHFNANGEIDNFNLMDKNFYVVGQDNINIDEPTAVGDLTKLTCTAGTAACTASK